MNIDFYREKFHCIEGKELSRFQDLTIDTLGAQYIRTQYKDRFDYFNGIN